ncbi:peptidase S9 prolyl oligopeptidase active site domain protein [Kribbella flavida DSM 17836]|uniref:Peptidase S9 prolyl oligopeptidase active site domain protein n=1 Tax=Kribbella flavida (strain DSM 17836 / JCM 10339 / NBRC 14399) TaxID=479435 RepID=D2PRW4_KRIFD|nr:alpha/beta fold hydrolase [Kribbella flavida]ADB29294.1 peptidase S9 prolyl oligopeptidase active site domain protein [Kribbella flavida DSM 17836]
MLPALLSLPSLVAFDIDSEGRLLIGYDGSGVRQVHEVAPDGTWRALTALSERVVAAKYVPGSRRVVVEHDTGGDERGQLSLLDLSEPGDLPTLQPLVHDAAYFHHLVTARPGRVLFTTNRRNDVDFDLVALDLGTGTQTTLYDVGGYLATVEPSPDDRWVGVIRAGGPANSGHVLLVETSTGRITDVTAYEDETCALELSWLPDSTGLLVSSDAGRDRIAVFRYDVADGSTTELVTDAESDLIGWASPSGQHLLVARSADGAVTLALHSTEGERLTPIELPPGGCAALLVESAPHWSPDGGQLVITYSSPAEPPYVFRYAVATGETVAVRAPEAAELPAGLRQPSSHRVASFDGEQVPVFVYRPESGGDGSAVIVVHGGPEWHAGLVFNPLVAGLVAEGHTVLVPNVRGSAGYGKRWYALDDRELRLDSVRDLAALHAWLPEIGVDQSRVALWGGSYGGYMVLAGLAFQPELWAAGVDIVGIASLVTFLENTSAYRRVVREREYGYLDRDREFLELASPLNRVDAIEAPLFVIHGANDPRVPLSEAEQVVAALAKRGVTSELLVYPDEGHGLAKRKNKLDAYPRAFAFLREQLGRE